MFRRADDYRSKLNAKMASSAKSPLPPRPQSVPVLSQSMNSDLYSYRLLNSGFRSPLGRDLGHSLFVKKGFHQSGDLFGSPCYPSPLDRIRSGKLNRALELGLSQDLQDSLDLNSTFPKMQQRLSKANKDDGEFDAYKPTLKQINSDSIHSFSYTPGHSRGSFVPSSSPQLYASLGRSWQFYNFVGGAGTGKVFPTTVRNPNKAIVTINARTSEILTANDMAVELFSYPRDQLIGSKMSSLFAASYREKQEALVEQHLEESGAVVLVSGKVLEAIDGCGVVFPVSIWMQKLKWEDQPRCITVLEPVERRTATILFNSEGVIAECDPQMAYLCGYTSPEDLCGLNIKKFIPAFILPQDNSTDLEKSVKKQQATGRTRDGATFPLTIMLQPKLGKDEKKLKQGGNLASEGSYYEGLVWVFANISGLVSVTPEGLIKNSNHNFSLMLFGYSEKDLVGKHITYLIPNFYDELDVIDDSSMPLPPMDEDDEFFLDCNPKSMALNSQETPVDSPDSNFRLNKNMLGLGDSNSSQDTSNLSSSQSTVESLRTPRESGTALSGPNKSLSSLFGGSIRETDISTRATYGDSTGFSMSSSGASIKANTQDGNCSLQFSTGDSGIEDKENDSAVVHSGNRTKGPVAFSSPVSTVSSADAPLEPEVDAGYPMSFPVNIQENYQLPDQLDTQCMTPPRPRGFEQLQVTSTPNIATKSQPTELDSPDQLICEGSFVGQARHRDGSPLGIIFQIKKIELSDGQVVFCLWVSRDPDDEGEGGRLQGDTAMPASFNSTCLDASISSVGELVQHLNDVSLKNEEPSPGRGRYDECYTTLKSIGKGAFGFVKLAQRRSDALQVVVKFIKKAKILPDCWVVEPQLGQVPLEISLLAKLKHSNIVQMLEAFENEDFFQVVMVKHGSGMDLFEFIDRQPLLDEPLCSYILRQIVAAVSFLHSKSILHRDVKDENIILNDKFHVKLIDFGSAAYMEPGKLFSTFCGTMEYCSPEVLLGNKYHGPELELWSIGVTLYTLVFGENPFYDVEETIRAELHAPFPISQELMFVICWLLHPNPNWRAKLQDLEENAWVNQPVDLESYNFDALFTDVQSSAVPQFPVPPAEIHVSGDELSEDEVIDYDQQDSSLLQSAYQEYLDQIDNDGVEDH